MHSLVRLHHLNHLLLAWLHKTIWKDVLIREKCLSSGLFKQHCQIVKSFDRWEERPGVKEIELKFETKKCHWKKSFISIFFHSWMSSLLTKLGHQVLSGDRLSFKTRTRNFLAPFDWFCSYQYKKTETTNTLQRWYRPKQRPHCQKRTREYYLRTLPAGVNQPNIHCPSPHNSFHRTHSINK